MPPLLCRTWRLCLVWDAVAAVVSCSDNFLVAFVLIMGLRTLVILLSDSYSTFDSTSGLALISDALGACGGLLIFYAAVL